MDWHIQFIIGGTRLERVLALIHSLNVRDLGVRPVAERQMQEATKQFMKRRRPVKDASGRLARGQVSAAVLERMQEGDLDASGIQDVISDIGGRVKSWNVIQRMLEARQITKKAGGLYGPRQEKE